MDEAILGGAARSARRLVPRGISDDRAVDQGSTRSAAVVTCVIAKNQATKGNIVADPAASAPGAISNHAAIGQVAEIGASAVPGTSGSVGIANEPAINKRS